MKRFPARWMVLCATLLPVAFPTGCGGDDPAAPTTGAGGTTAGAAGTNAATAGAAGTTAGAGAMTAGTGGATAGAGGTAGSTAGAAGSTAGTTAAGAAGTSAGTGGATAGAGGVAGAAGNIAGAAGSTAGVAGSTAAGAAGTSAGAGGAAANGGGGGVSSGIAAVCAAVHGVTGCCSADGRTSYSYIEGFGVEERKCAASEGCAWVGGIYRCVQDGDGETDPSGVAPFACGGPELPRKMTECPLGCQSSSDCQAEPQKSVCSPKDKACVQCVTNADCGGGSVCSGNSCVACVTDADCKGNAKGPRCLPSNECVQCMDDEDCVGNAAGPTCDSNRYVCDVGCAKNEDCKEAARPLCNLGTTFCQKDGPITCEAAHGDAGCCSADGKTRFYAWVFGHVLVEECTGSNVCTWVPDTGASGRYDCAPGPAVSDPSNVFPMSCGGPTIPREKTGCPAN